MERNDGLIIWILAQVSMWGGGLHHGPTGSAITAKSGLREGIGYMASHGNGSTHSLIQWQRPPSQEESKALN